MGSICMLLLLLLLWTLSYISKNESSLAAECGHQLVYTEDWKNVLDSRLLMCTNTILYLISYRVRADIGKMKDDFFPNTPKYPSNFLKY